MICTHALRKAASEPSNWRRHLSTTCLWKREKVTLMDLAKQQYASRLQEGVGILPSLQVAVADHPSSQELSAKEGWAVKEVKKPYRFSRIKKAIWRPSLMSDSLPGES